MKCAATNCTSKEHAKYTVVRIFNRAAIIVFNVGIYLCSLHRRKVDSTE